MCLHVYVSFDVVDMTRYNALSNIGHSVIKRKGLQDFVALAFVALGNIEARGTSRI